jgi:hypothetical protein
MENFPNLDSHLDAIVTQNGKFMVTDFHVGFPQKGHIGGTARQIAAV